MGVGVWISSAHSLPLICARCRSTRHSRLAELEGRSTTAVVGEEEEGGEEGGEDTDEQVGTSSTNEPTIEHTPGTVSTDRTPRSHTHANSSMSPPQVQDWMKEAVGLLSELRGVSFLLCTVSHLYMLVFSIHTRTQTH